MDRRTFALVLAGTCLLEPLALGARQAGKVFRIGLLAPYTEHLANVGAALRSPDTSDSKSTRSASHGDGRSRQKRLERNLVEIQAFMT